jgi:MFS family permease
LLTCATFQPFIVALSDVFGRKPALLGSVLLFTLGTLTCCLSQNFTQLLVGRSIQGIGGGGVTNLPNVIFTDFVPLRQRPTYNAFNQMAWAVGTITGPLIGGLFADHKTWRWAFYISFPFCFVGIVMVPLVVRLEAERPSLKERLLYVDWIGGILFIASTFSFLYGVTSGGSKYSWSNWRTLLPIVLGIVGNLLTLLWERYTSKPFLRLSIFNSRSAYAAYLAATLQGVLVGHMKSPCPQCANAVTVVL